MFTYSFYSDQNPDVWVGLTNYFTIFGDPEFWDSMSFSFIWAFVAVALQTIIGLALALLLNETFRGRNLARSLIFLPYVITVPVVAILFSFLFGGLYGLFSYYLRGIGIVVDSWYNVQFAPITLTLASVWKYAPFSMLVLLAGLQGIPTNLYEAAKIDGASAWSRFRHITLPNLTDTISVAVLLRVIWMFNKFDLPWNMTKGGPLRVTQNLPIYVYRQAFEYFHFGTSAASAMVILLIVIVFIYLHSVIFAKIGGS